MAKLAETTLRAHGGKKTGGSEARVPSDVRDYLGAGKGDRLIFEDGCEETARRLLTLGGKFVLLRRAARPGETVAAVQAVKIVKPAAPPPPPAAPQQQPESFASVVHKYRQERRR